MTRTTQDHLAEIAEQGFTVLERVVPDDLCDALLADLARLESELGAVPSDNAFEGRATTRVYNLLAHGGRWPEVPVLAPVLDVVDGVLDDGCLVSSLSSVRIRPGESAQPIHSDDQLYPVVAPDPPVVCNTMWALTDFTDRNGATRLVPGSHRGPKPEFGGDYPTVPAEMPRGSVLVWHGRLWHGGGANTTGEDRVGIAMNYCAGWVRQQENQQLGVPPETVASFGPRLRRLVGYGVYLGLIGHVEKQSAEQALLPPRRGAGSGDDGMVWDAT
ncbi:MAG: phytanoyl-CoA dioxygenase family protein [Actinomycetes bacterium]